jgi:hypothetical protein
MPTIEENTAHKWRFFRLGGFDQVRLDRGADLLALDQLDQKLWAALSCPTVGLEFDHKTLELIDTDGDGRIRVPEIIAAVQWAGAVLKNPDDLVQGAAELPLSAIDDSHADGQQLLAAAKEILKNLGKPDATVITTEDTADLEKIFANTRFNGDGIVPVEAADDDALRTVIQNIIDCLGSETDRSGALGVSQDKVELFFTEAQAYANWWDKAEEGAAEILFLGDETIAGAAAVKAIQTKLDDYFTRCQLATFDAHAAGFLNSGEPEYKALAAKNLSAATEEIAALPLAHIEAGRPLPLKDGVNPAWADAIGQLQATVIRPLFGDKQSLTAAEWATIKNKFVAYETWLAGKAGAAVEALGAPRIREILAGGGKDALTALIDKDKALEPVANVIHSVDRLIRYHRDLYRLLNNFVSLRDFYSGKTKAIFQAGTLYIDGRSCDLCIRVADVDKHGALANLSGTYLAYCNLTRRGSSEQMTIVAAFTNGDADNLMVGRNGVFYDRQGQDWDATIVKLVEHPISIRQAFWSPYKRIGRMVREQIEKAASARDKAVETKAAAGIADTAQKADAGQPPPAAPFDVAKFAGIFAAIGLAIGAIGTALAAVVTGFLGLLWWQMPLAIVGLLLVISGPSMVMAWLKLRGRNLAPILDANGWAVNTLAKINIPFGTALTQIAKLPPGAERSLQDPYAEKKRPWKTYLFLLILAAVLAVLGYKGYLRTWYEQYLAKPMAAALEPTTQPAPPAAAPAAAPPAAPPAETPPAASPAAPANQ